MQQPFTVRIDFEVCYNCPSHSWFTRHDERKYKEVYSEAENLIMSNIPTAKITKNIVPPNLLFIERNYYKDTHTNKIVNYPRIGAFEVSVNSVRVFSKNISKKFPSPTILLKLINEFLDNGHTFFPKAAINLSIPKKKCFKCFSRDRSFSKNEKIDESMIMKPGPNRLFSPKVVRRFSPSPANSKRGIVTPMSQVVQMQGEQSGQISSTAKKNQRQKTSNSFTVTVPKKVYLKDLKTNKAKANRTNEQKIQTEVNNFVLPKIGDLMNNFDRETIRKMIKSEIQIAQEQFQASRLNATNPVSHNRSSNSANEYQDEEFESENNFELTSIVKSQNKNKTMPNKSNFNGNENTNIKVKNILKAKKLNSEIFPQQIHFTRKINVSEHNSQESRSKKASVNSSEFYHSNNEFSNPYLNPDYAFEQVINENIPKSNSIEDNSEINEEISQIEVINESKGIEEIVKDISEHFSSQNEIQKEEFKNKNEEFKRKTQNSDPENISYESDFGEIPLSQEKIQQNISVTNVFNNNKGEATFNPRNSDEIEEVKSNSKMNNPGESEIDMIELNNITSNYLGGLGLKILNEMKEREVENENMLQQFISLTQNNEFKEENRTNEQQISKSKEGNFNHKIQNNSEQEVPLNPFSHDIFNDISPENQNMLIDYATASQHNLEDENIDSKTESNPMDIDHENEMEIGKNKLDEFIIAKEDTKEEILHEKSDEGSQLNSFNSVLPQFSNNRTSNFSTFGNQIQQKTEFSIARSVDANISIKPYFFNIGSDAKYQKKTVIIRNVFPPVDTKNLVFRSQNLVGLKEDYKVWKRHNSRYSNSPLIISGEDQIVEEKLANNESSAGDLIEINHFRKSGNPENDSNSKFNEEEKMELNLVVEKQEKSEEFDYDNLESKMELKLETQEKQDKSSNKQNENLNAIDDKMEDLIIQSKKRSLPSDILPELPKLDKEKRIFSMDLGKRTTMLKKLADMGKRNDFSIMEGYIEPEDIKSDNQQIQEDYKSKYERIDKELQEIIADSESGVHNHRVCHLNPLFLKNFLKPFLTQREYSLISRAFLMDLNHEKVSFNEDSFLWKFLDEFFESVLDHCSPLNELMKSSETYKTLHLDLNGFSLQSLKSKESNEDSFRKLTSSATQTFQLRKDTISMRIRRKSCENERKSSLFMPINDSMSTDKFIEVYLERLAEDADNEYIEYISNLRNNNKVGTQLSNGSDFEVKSNLKEIVNQDNQVGNKDEFIEYKVEDPTTNIELVTSFLIQLYSEFNLQWM